jgi:protocatechuate 3,4-dioxygenase beta subunit
LWLAGLAPRSWAQQTPTCIVRPAQMEGPYFVESGLERSDIRSDPSDGSIKQGVPLELEFRVLSSAGSRCAPLPGAIVDIWHCDAQGIYSDAKDSRFDTRGQRFLRGYQTTDAEGRVRFQTIYPGWYEGRAVHVHFKVRRSLGPNQGVEFTSQAYFDDALNERVHAQLPYTKEAGKPNTSRNDKDEIFQDGGSELMLALSPRNQGFAARFELALAES